MSESDPVIFADEGDGILSLTLNRPNSNIIDSAMVAALKGHIEDIRAKPEVKAVILAGAGKNFSFGASVEEHMPGSVASMLHDLHTLMKAMMASHVTFIAAINGYCLGGGLEVASFCHRVIGSPSSQYGQPEIQLGVFAPVASVILPHRCGQAVADDLLLTGKTVDAEEALRCGLIDAIEDDPLASALSYARAHFASKSASSLRLAVAASRRRFHRQFSEDIDALEKLYLDELMSTQDAVEGITAFLEKRAATWTNS